MPFPSRGCQTCKVRRIKCDETSPICLKCVKSKRVCKRMVSGQDVALVHIENQYASGQRKRPRGPRPIVDANQIGHPRSTVPHTSCDLSTLAVAYYVRCHLQLPSDNPELLKSLLHCVLARWTPNAHYQMLELAVSSKALATFSRTQKYPPAALEASSRYRTLLCMAYNDITHLNKDNIDACLLAIFFMGRYEGVVYETSRTQSPFLSTLQSFAHHDGAFAILMIWKYRFSHVQPPSDIVKLTRRGLIRSALLRALEIPHWMLEGGAFGECGIELEYDRIVVQIANIRHRLYALLVDQRTHFGAGKRRAAVEGLYQETQETDEALQRWAAGFPSLWSFTQHTFSTTGIWSSEKYFYSPTVYSYSSPSFAGAWATYYATRMLILSTWTSILEASQLSTGGVARECQQNLKQTGIDLASSLPFCLQRFNLTGDHKSIDSHDSIRFLKTKEVEPHLAALIVWPLSLASSLKHVEVAQQKWFRSVLTDLGRIIGVSMLEYANTNRWPKF